MKAILCMVIYLSVVAQNSVIFTLMSQQFGLIFLCWAFLSMPLLAKAVPVVASRGQQGLSITPGLSSIFEIVTSLLSNKKAETCFSFFPK